MKKRKLAASSASSSSKNDPAKSKNDPPKTKKDPPKSNQKSIRSFFQPCDKSAASNESFLFKEEDSDSDIEVLGSSKRCHEQLDDDVIVMENNFKKAKIDRNVRESGQAPVDHSLEENLDASNLPSTSIGISSSASSSSAPSAIKKEKRAAKCDQEVPSKDFNFNNLFESPTKKQVNYPFNLTCPSPYFKNFSESLDKSYQDLNEYLNVHLEDIRKTKTPTKSSKKSSAAGSVDASSVRRELSFNDSPTKQSPTKLNLTSRRELTYSEINRNNFQTILRSVIDDPLNKCLFNDSDWNTISVYTSLSNDAQSLLLRLFFRKNAWIKRSAIKYEEFMENLEALLDELLSSKFLVDTSGLASLEEGLFILEPAEVKEFAKQSKVAIQSSGKQKMIECILNFVRTTKTLSFSTSKISLEERKLNELKRFLGARCFKVDMDNAKVLLRIVLLYFPPIYFEKNLNQLLNDTFFNLYNNLINSSTFPSYVLNKTIQVYARREDQLLYTDACIMESIINEGNSITADELDAMLKKALEKYEDYVKVNFKLDMNLPYFLRKLTAGQKLLRCISQCVTLLEKCKRYEEANSYLELLLKQNVYCLTDRGKWYDRLVTNCESHLKDEQKAYDYCTQAFEDFYVRKAPELNLCKKAVRLAKKLKLETFRPLPVLNIPERQFFANTVKRKVDLRNNVFYELNDQGGFDVLRVENVALNYYVDELGFKKGLHSENELFNVLFFLMFFEQIFVQDAQIKDIFRFAFQRLPLDFGSDSFYESRAAHFERRFDHLAELSNERIFELIEQEYEKYKSLQTIISLESIDLNDLKEIILCIDIGSLLKVCRRLAEDHRFTRSGFPDLIVWNCDEKKIKAVEVKGELFAITNSGLFRKNSFDDNHHSEGNYRLTLFLSSRKARTILCPKSKCFGSIS